MNYKTIAAIIGITIIECFAIHKGMNGVALTAAVGILAGLGGYSLKVIKEGK